MSAINIQDENKEAVANLNKYENDMHALSAERRDECMEEFETTCIEDSADKIFCRYSQSPCCNVMIHSILYVMLTAVFASLGYYWYIHLQYKKPELLADYEGAASTMKEVVGFLMGFYIFALLDSRNGVLNSMGSFIVYSNDLMALLNGISWADEESKVNVARYLVASQTCYFAQANDQLTDSERTRRIRQLVDRQLLTEEEFQCIDAATNKQFYVAHKAPLSWVKKTLSQMCENNADGANSETAFRALNELAKDAGRALDDWSGLDVPAPFRLFLFGLIVFICTMECIVEGIHISEVIDHENAFQKVSFCVTQLMFEISFNVCIMEICSQMVNNVLGEDCLDVDAGDFMADFTGQMQMYFKFDVAEASE